MFVIVALKRLLILVAFLAVMVLGGLFWWASSPLNLPAGEIDFRVLPGMTVRQAITQMNQAGADMEPSLTLLLIKAWGIDSKLKAGTYTLTPGLTRFDVLKKLKNGDISLIDVRFPEGLTFNQWLQILANEKNLEHRLQLSTSMDEIRRAVGISEPLVEGLFFPNTYKVDKGSSDVELLQKAYRSQQDQLKTAWAKRAANLPYRSPYEALIMASIVEKETGKADDRQRVAAVFVNRLRTGMRLQTDPTVIYGMGSSFAGNIRKADLQTDTPYNTYTRGGLPPSPIAMPGLASIEAALHPANEDIYYFVARGDGSSQFSRTLAEHNAAVARYQLRQ